MKNVGSFQKRNDAFAKKYNREIIISETIKKKIPVIFDVGSHFGESYKLFKKIFPKSKVYCFEPDPDSFEILKKKFPKIPTFYNLAISNKVGKFNFYQNSISHTNSLNKINLKSKDSVILKNRKKNKDSEFYDSINRKISVPTVTIDSFLKEKNLKKIDLLKIDVQGAEEKVLLGAKYSLKIVENIMIEISFFDFYENSTSFLDIEKILISSGFKLFSILDISQNPMNGRTDWVEILYKKNS